MTNSATVLFSGLHTRLPHSPRLGAASVDTRTAAKPSSSTLAAANPAAAPPPLAIAAAAAVAVHYCAVPCCKPSLSSLVQAAAVAEQARAHTPSQAHARTREVHSGERERL